MTGLVVPVVLALAKPPNIAALTRIVFRSKADVRFGLRLTRSCGTKLPIYHRGFREANAVIRSSKSNTAYYTVE